MKWNFNRSAVFALGLGFFASAPQAKDIVEFQPNKTETELSSGSVKIRVTNLNSHIGAWFLIKVEGSWSSALYNLENYEPGRREVYAAADFPEGLYIKEAGVIEKCELWKDPWNNPLSAALKQATEEKVSYVKLCGGKLYLRNQVSGGGKTWKSYLSEKLSDSLPSLVNAGKELLGTDEPVFEKEEVTSQVLRALPIDGEPLPADVEGKTFYQQDLGIPLIGLEGSDGKQAIPGKWYPVKDQTGVYVSMVNPARIKGTTSTALSYHIAFDTDYIEMGWAHGTEQPGVEWSSRYAGKKSDGGPDGFSNMRPLALTASINPVFYDRLIATFSGGFRRLHGFFRVGTKLGAVNNGSPYGFIENGVVQSSLKPGLATVLMFKDGSIDVKTWKESDTALLPSIRHARQNGVPLVEYDEKTQTGVEGAYTREQYEGNWSGDANGNPTSVRSAASIQVNGKKKFLIFSYFSSARPWDLAKVMLAYHCRDSVHLDMNSARFAYFALAKLKLDAKNQFAGFEVQPLVHEMSEMNRSISLGDQSATLPRYVASDFRDFFYIYKKTTSP